MIGHCVVIFPVAGHQLVQVDLRDEGNDKVIRAPEERDTDTVRIRFCAFHDLFDTAAIISSELELCSRIDQRIQREMPNVGERILFVMLMLIGAHLDVLVFHPRR